MPIHVIVFLRDSRDFLQRESGVDGRASGLMYFVTIPLVTSGSARVKMAARSSTDSYAGCCLSPMNTTTRSPLKHAPMARFGHIRNVSILLYPGSGHRNSV